MPTLYTQDTINTANENQQKYRAPEPKSIKHIKILVISENSSDIFMIKKLFPKEDGYTIHEVATLSSALKAIHYLNFDMIFVDDMLSQIDGYDVVDKLSRIELIQEIPKILLLTTGFQPEKKASFRRENVDFIKKPFDSVIFKVRVHTLLKQKQQQKVTQSYFKKQAQEKFEEAQHVMSFYQDVFEQADTLMCIYDAGTDTIVEANAKFEKFFVRVAYFNRIFKNAKLARKFVPVMDEVNYLNYYTPKEWMKTLIEGGDFTYHIKLYRDYKAYSFAISIKKHTHLQSDIYVLSLSNVYDYLPKSTTKTQLKETNFTAFKEEFVALREKIQSHAIEDKDMDTLLYQMSTKLSIICEDASIVQAKKISQEVNVYFILATLLKEKFLTHNMYLNQDPVTLDLQEDKQLLYASLDANALRDVVFGILNNFYGNTFFMKQSAPRADISIHKKENQIFLDLWLAHTPTSRKEESFVGKIFTKKSTFEDGDIVDTLPKNIKQSLKILHAQLHKKIEKRQTLFRVQIDL